MIDVCPLGTGATVGGAIPTAGQTVELRYAASAAVEHRHLGLEDVGTACQCKYAVTLHRRSNDVGGEYPGTVNGFLTPVGDDNKCEVNDAVAGISYMEIYRLVMCFRAERYPVEKHRHIFWGDGVVNPVAMRTGDEVDFPEGVAARLGPVGGYVVCVGIFQFMPAECV